MTAHNRKFIAISGAALLLGAAAAGPAAAAVQVFQGQVFVTAVNAPCTAASAVAVGDHYLGLFRSVLNPSFPLIGGGFSLHGQRSAAVYQLPAGIALPGGAQSKTVPVTGVSSRVGIFAFTSTYTLNIAPAAIVATTPYVTITGTLTNFFDTAGCTVSIRGAFTVRP